MDNRGVWVSSWKSSGGLMDGRLSPRNARIGQGKGIDGRKPRVEGYSLASVARSKSCGILPSITDSAADNVALKASGLQLLAKLGSGFKVWHHTTLLTRKPRRTQVATPAALAIPLTLMSVFCFSFVNIDRGSSRVLFCITISE